MKPFRVGSVYLTGFCVLLATACESRTPIDGIGRTPPAPSPSTTSTTSLSGQVFEVTPAGRFALADIGVTVVVMPAAGGVYTHMTTTAAPDGRYAFVQLPPGSAVVYAHSPGRLQICGALPALTASTLQDLEVTSTANPQRSPDPPPLRVTGQIYEMTQTGRVGLGGAVIHVYFAPDGYFYTAVADADGYYQACGIPANRPVAFEVARDLSAGYGGEYEIPYLWYSFGADATRDIELKRRQ